MGLLSLLIGFAMHFSESDFGNASLHGAASFTSRNQVAYDYDEERLDESAYTQAGNSPNLTDYGVNVSYKVEQVYPGPQVLARIRECEETITRAYFSFPYLHRTQLKSLKFLWTKNTQRGLGGESSIHLKCNDMSAAELTAVFVHEMGHIVDTGLIEGQSSAGPSHFVDRRASVFQNDPSIDFYAISWKNATMKWGKSSGNDFVTGYAMSDPFEDFAESYNFYLLHGSQFRYMSRFNKKLEQKYAYLRDRIFSGQEFWNNDIKLNAKRRSYDSTLLPFSLENFLTIY